MFDMENTQNIKLLYIDLFCGAGGTSTGVESARIEDEKCAKVIACVNHDANAIASHAANHPDAYHCTEDIRTLELHPLIEHAKKMLKLYPESLLILWASLECTNFSKAKGGQSRDADSRTLANHLFRYFDTFKAAGCEFDYIQIENVEEFMSWGDVDENGKPISKDKGRDYLRWIARVQKYGYDFEHRILNSADFGAYTARKRFFGQFVKKDLPLTWPVPTYSKIGGTTGLFGYQKKWKAVRDVLNLDDDGRSIFDRKTPLSDKTFERIYAGLIKFVAGGKNQWLLKYNSINGKTGKHIPPDIDEPSPVIACQSRLGLVSTKFISKYYSGHPESKNVSIEQPGPTVTTRDHNSLVSANFLSAYYGSGDNVSDIDNPAPTITTKDRLALVSSKFMVSYSFNDKGKDINEPCPTVLTKDRLAIVSSQFITSQYTNGFNTDLEAPNPTLTANPKQSLVTVKPWIMDTSFNNTGSSLDEPARVITANRKWHYLMNPQYASAGGSVENPCFTLIARMDKMPPYLIITEEGELYIEVYESDTEIVCKIKEFMAIYGISDIKMRMLYIYELLQIMGFPKDYRLIGTQADQKKFIGNAVEVNTAKALCEQIVLRLNEIRKKAYA